MKNKYFLSLLLGSILLQAGAQDFTKFVNPFIGTTNEGNTVPGATMPFGMVQLSPDTRITSPSGYDYKDSVILGFSYTHLSGTGIGDLGDILTMPVNISSNNLSEKFLDFSSSFSHAKEKASPGFYSVYLNKPQTSVALTATERCGMQQYTFAKNEKTQGIFIDLAHSIFGTRDVWMPDDVYDCNLTIENHFTISGYKKSKGWAPQQQVYFVMQFNQPISQHFLKNRKGINATITSVTDSTLQAILLFKNPGTILFKTGISANSIAGARINLQAEMTHWNFDKYRQQAKTAWNKYLEKIVIETNAVQKEIFYTALYHTLVTPNLISDVDGTYFGPDFKIHVSKYGQYYSTFSLWDTYRAVHPLYSIICPEKNGEFINSMLEHFEVLGRLPLWTLWGTENYCMTGNHAIPVIVDAFLKGNSSFDTALAWRAIKQSATKLYPAYDFDVLKNYGYLPSNFGEYGSRGDRNRYDLIDRHGFLPHDSVRASVTNLLELCYNDWCIAQMAKRMGRQSDYNYFIKRSSNYKNIFDTSLGFVRPRNADGKWEKPFDPYSFTDWKTSAFAEGNAFQYSFYVPQQVDSMIKLFGGKTRFEQMIDSLFTIKNKEGNIGGAITGLIGQYAHGNEPSHHIAYLYNFIGKQNKTAGRVYNILQTQYSNKPDGLCGNDDCGQMSAWYVYSVLGFYPINPADGKYYFGTSPLTKATIHCSNKKTFFINYHGSGKGAIYVDTIKLNGKKIKATFLQHASIVNGGQLDMYMTAYKANSK